MAATHGSRAYFMAGASVNLTTYLDNVALQRSTDIAESSTMGLADKTYVSGLNEGTISLSGKYDSVAGGPDVTLAALAATTTASTFFYGPEGSTTGKIKYSGSAYCTKYDVTAPIGDVVAFAADFKVTGAITKGTF